jgi:1-acyl-sn-glycerol-3-phosphate acyltransferase
MTLLRSLLFNLWFFGLTAVMALAALPLRAFAPQRAIPYARTWIRLVLGGLRLLCDITYEVRGLEHLPPDGPALIASQHQSAFDTLVWALLAPRFAYVLKRELTRIPLFGPMLLLTGMVPVDRDAGAGAVRALLREADRALGERRQIIIFPEGTRVAPGTHAVLHPGVAALAARTKLPVIPVVTDSGRRWGRRTFHKRPGVIHIVLLPPIEPGLRREALMQRLEAAFAGGAAVLGDPVDKSVGGPLPRLPLRAS